MVNKIAVMAVVALVAIPIGLGYALNFQDVEYTRYTDDKITNVTEYLQTGTMDTYAATNTYSLNTFNYRPYGNVLTSANISTPIVPEYKKMIHGTSASISYLHDSSLMGNPSGNSWIYGYTGITVPGPLQLRLTITGTYNAGTFDNPIFYQCVPDSNGTFTVYLIYAAYDPATGTYSNTKAASFFYALATGGFSWNRINYTGTPDKYWRPVTLGDYPQEAYPDLNQGFSIGNKATGTVTVNTQYASPVSQNWLFSQGGVRDVLFTIDMSQVTGGFELWQNAYTGSYTQNVNRIQIVNNGDTHTFAGVDLLYNDGKPNIYQIWIRSSGFEVRYIGQQWPNQMGEANYFRSWFIPFMDNENVTDPLNYTRDPLYIQGLQFTGLPDGQNPSATYPNRTGYNIGQMRFDYAASRQATIKVIEDNTYDPAKLMGAVNVKTTLTDVALPGISVSFGGETFTVSENKLIFHGVKIPLKGLKFESHVNESNTYDNLINGTLVSTTAEPSTITFNGRWGGNISSASLAQETGTEQKWIAGGWAWDGVGVSFGMVGLVACVGVFIALGMYGRRSGAKVGALMLVCAGGALIFLSLL